MKLTPISHAIAAALLALAACGGSRPAPTSPPDPGSAAPAPTDGCSLDIAIRCANGVDGCDDGRTTEHICVPVDAQPGPPCEQEIALVCPEGQIDACLRTPAPAKNHICVYN